MSVSIKVAVRCRPFTIDDDLGVNLTQCGEEEGEASNFKSLICSLYMFPVSQKRHGRLVAFTLLYFSRHRSSEGDAKMADNSGSRKLSFIGKHASQPRPGCMPGFLYYRQWIACLHQAAYMFGRRPILHRVSSD